MKDPEGKQQEMPPKKARKHLEMRYNIWDIVIFDHNIILLSEQDITASLIFSLTCRSRPNFCGSSTLETRQGLHPLLAPKFPLEVQGDKKDCDLPLKGSISRIVPTTSSQDNKTLLTEDMSGRHSFNENGKRLMSRYYQRWTLPEDRAWGRRGSWRVVEPAVGQSPLGKPVTNPLMFGLGVNTYIWLASKNTWKTRPSPWVMTSSMATPLC